MDKDNVINPQMASITMDVAAGSKHKIILIGIEEGEDRHTTQAILPTTSISMGWK